MEIIHASRNVGLTGAPAIHPYQVKWIKEAYTVPAAEIAEMKKIVKLAEGKGVFSHNGRMYGPPMRKRYKRLLEEAEEEK
jgi:citrate lyase beta subunit